MLLEISIVRNERRRSIDVSYELSMLVYEMQKMEFFERTAIENRRKMRFIE